jgi:hypothetical protein
MSMMNSEIAKVISAIDKGRCGDIQYKDDGGKWLFFIPVCMVDVMKRILRGEEFRVAPEIAWKRDEVPDNIWIRFKVQGTGIPTTGLYRVVAKYENALKMGDLNGLYKYDELLRQCEFSFDGTLTGKWFPCGKEVG